MKRMWSEEEVNAAIAEYAAAHPAGGKLYQHLVNMLFQDSADTKIDLTARFVTTSPEPVNSFAKFPEGAIPVKGYLKTNDEYGDSTEQVVCVSKLPYNSKSPDFNFDAFMYSHIQGAIDWYPVDKGSFVVYTGDTFNVTYTDTVSEL